MRGVQGACETPIMDLTLFDHFYGMKILQKFSSFEKKIIPPLPFLKESHEHVCPSHLILNEK